MLDVLVDQPVAVQAVSGQDHQHDEIRDHDGQVEGVELVEAAEGIPARVGQLGPIVRERALRRGDDHEFMQANHSVLFPPLNMLKKC